MVKRFCHDAYASIFFAQGRECEMEKKKVNKKALDYVRPQMGHFDLKAFPGVTFSFRKITLDDDPWCVKNLGASPWAIINSEKNDALTLCRMYFHFLTPESQEHFPAVKEESKDDDTGEVKERFVTRPEAFMRAIDGGNTVELLLVANAFAETLFSSRSVNDLPEALKKSLMKQAEKQKAVVPKAPEAQL